MKILILLTVILCFMCSMVHADILIKSNNQEIIPEYTFILLKERLELLTNISVIESQTSNDNDITVNLVLADKIDKNDESFTIDIDSKIIKISSASGNGIMYGVCHLIEWIMANTTDRLGDNKTVDIDFPVKKGQARNFIRNLPTTSMQDKPFYSMRSFQMTNMALNVGDLIETDTPYKKYNTYSGIAEGNLEQAEIWKMWCDWAARHRANCITNWPYSTGTNWWELALSSTTRGMSHYPDKEILLAAQKRKELLKYARSRGLTPLFMNYVPGGANPHIQSNYPEIIGTRSNPEYPLPFIMSSPKTIEIFEAQIRAIMRQYPSLGGLHVRWWGESFPSEEDLLSGQYRNILENLTEKIINIVKEEKPDGKMVLYKQVAEMSLQKDFLKISICKTNGEGIGKPQMTLKFHLKE
ncbi:MAG: hypothetical protein SNJ70_04695 [Armatimonadota bacterium]